MLSTTTRSYALISAYCCIVLPLLLMLTTTVFAQQQHFYLRSKKPSYQMRKLQTNSSTAKNVATALQELIPVTLQVNITRFPNTQGKLCWGLYEESMGEFGETGSAGDCVGEIPMNRRMSIDIATNITAYGSRYALALYHDTNDNGKLDTTRFFGFDIPREYFGFSNNPSVGPRGIDFDDCLFGVNEPRVGLEIRLQSPPI